MSPGHGHLVYERDDGRPHSWAFPLVVLRIKRIHSCKGFKIAACMKSTLCYYHSQKNYVFCSTLTSSEEEFSDQVFSGECVLSLTDLRFCLFG